MESIQKFQELLKRLFQFETSDLDFGIYRILNYKQEQIKRFIEEDLKNKVESAFTKHKDERLSNINQRFEEAKEKIVQSLGKDAFTPTGELKEQFKDTPLGRDFHSLKAQKDEAEAIDEIRLQVFNDLYNFFSRYYEEGDFVPHYRYSVKGHKYAIPYNGEEVKLYWANSEQYYTKTGLLFRDYTFKADRCKVIFRIVSAKEELASNKATKERFFILDDEEPLTVEDKTLIVRFQYRELTEKEVKRYEVEGGSNVAKQEKINQKSYEEVLTRIKNITLKAILSTDKQEKPLLLYHFNRFTAKNTKDYFIHKNLKKFLSEQLDYFIKAGVLDIETLEKERFLDKHITRARVIREIGEDIIDFLSQIEDFQKRLWEKKKFVLKTEYVITTDRVSEEFYEEIWTHEEQRKEWEELGFEIPKTKEDLKNKKLPVDTIYFSDDLKERLLEKLTEKADLDDLLDGVLIKSENWQALNLLLRKYKEKVQTIYIDPPFNKEQDADYLYNVKYKDSTWISLLEDRLWLAKELLSDRGSIFVNSDDNGNMYVRLLMEQIYGMENFRNEIIWCYEKPGGPTDRLKNNHSNVYFFGKSKDSLLIPIFVPRKGETELTKREGRWGTDYEGKISPDWWIDIPSFATMMTAGERTKHSIGVDFLTQQPEKLLQKIIGMSSKEGDLALDYFLGSGTTTAVAHKLKRKWIGIEMGEHFWSVVLPRMKKVLAYDKSGISKEKDVKEKYNEKTAGGFFKYQILEQYEDTLDNIELTPNEQAQSLFKDVYLLKYFLDYETRESPYLLNIEHLKNPFSYKLKVNLEEVGEPEEIVVDIPETFNYLLGLKAKKIKVRRNGRKYLFILGEKDGKEIAIVWREYDDKWNEEDFKKDKEFIIKELESWAPYIVYVNGQSVLTPKLGKHTVEVRYIEPEFKRLMEG